MPVIKAENISLSYSMHKGIFSKERIEAVKGISFEVNRGEMFSIIGLNGSGKTTTLTLVSGIMQPDSGSIEVKGRVVPFLGLGIGFNPELTGRENIYLYGAVMGMTGKMVRQVYDSIVEFSELRRFMDMKIKEYSSGMYVRLGFSVAIHTKPDILIIDEVLAVGDISFQRKCLERIERMKQDGVSILFVSHDLGLVARYSDRVMLMHEGSKVTEGMPEKVIDRYLHMKDNMPSLNPSRRGSREIEIESYQLDREERSYEQGDNVKIKLQYRNNSAIKECIAGFALYSESGVLLAGPNILETGGRLLHAEQTGRIEMEFSTASLNPGNYYLTLALYDSTNRFPLDHIDYALRFTIKGKHAEHMGYINLDVKWKE